MGLPKEYIYNIIKRNLKSEDFEFISYEDSNLKDQSIGFLSSQNRKCIKYKTCGKEEELYIFIKQLPVSESHRKTVIELGLFERESLILDEILVDFLEYSIPIPKCFLAKPDSMVVLEDLSHSGFQNKSVYEPLDLLHCEKVLESLAKFHAASFIIEKRKGTKLNLLYPILETEVLLNPDDNHSGKRCCLVGIKALKKVTEEYMPQYPKGVINKAFEFMENVFDKLHSSKRYPNALSHSDIWVNNIMFKYNNKGQVERAQIIDLQFVTYKPPSYDLQFFLHTCTTKEFRDRHYDQLLKYYIDNLSKQLLLSNINLDGIMSWTDFENMLEETRPLILVVSAIYLKFILMPPEVVKDLMVSDEKYNSYLMEDRTEYVLRAMIENGHYKERNLQALTELFEYFMSN